MDKIGYLADGETYRYPMAGDPFPPNGTKVLLLTLGHVCVVGTWSDEGYLAWLPLPKRNKVKEDYILLNARLAVSTFYLGE